MGERFVRLTSLLGSVALAAVVYASPAAAQKPDGAFWSSAAKTGIGTAYEAYAYDANGRPSYRDDGPSGAISKVWFSIAKGTLTETQYGLIHETQIRRLRLAVVTSTGLAVEGKDTTSRTEYLHLDSEGRPLSPAYRVITTDKKGRFEIEKHIFTDPDRQVLFLRVTVRALKGPVTPYVLLEPSMANTGIGDSGFAAPQALSASEGKVALTLKGAKPFTIATATQMGPGDSLHDLADGRIDKPSAATGTPAGPILLTAGLSPVKDGQTTYDLAIGFGPDRATSQAQAEGALAVGYQEVLAHYNGEGDRLGWEDYVASLDQLPRLKAQTGDRGRLLNASALMIKVQEDHTYAGALIASLSNPWGEEVPSRLPGTGYKAVWPRDFYQCAMALAALGDRQTPVAAFRYLPKVQVGPSTPGNHGDGGWFLQKTHVDGTPEWVGVQLDQTAMPIMLGWKLWKLGWLTDADIKTAYAALLRPAANFLVDGGKVSLDWNKATIKPPFTQQERWEEQAGYSPSTTAAVITGLTVAADMATLSGDAPSAEKYLAKADLYSGLLDSKMVTHTGRLGDGSYYLRLNTDEDPNNHSPMDVRNAQQAVGEDLMMDAGFLELVRYGVRPADNAAIVGSLPELDDETGADMGRVKYTLIDPKRSTPRLGWRRYGYDGYGEDQVTGAGYAAGGQAHAEGRGRIWPLLTGERGHYELAKLIQSGNATPEAVSAIRDQYAGGMESFANEGLLISEQVWDGVGKMPEGAKAGDGTDSATPLSWSHAEYVKLLRSLADRAVWDTYAPVVARFSKRAPSQP